MVSTTAQRRLMAPAARSSYHGCQRMKPCPPQRSLPSVLG
jgi:hypothetical protein